MPEFERSIPPASSDRYEEALYDATRLEVDEKEQRRIELYNTLLTGVEAVKTEPGYKAYLEAMAKFHNYSFGNVMLIQQQDPEATRVAGYTRWKSLGRQVERGTKGIAIMVPHRQKIRDEETGEDVFTLRGFGIGHVFDIRNTTGDPLPEPPTVQDLDGNDPLGDELFSRINDIVTDRIGASWTRKPFHYGNARGLWNPAKREIALREGLYPDQEVKTFLHEAVHAYRNDQVGTDRQRAEMIAESSTFVILNRFGLDTSRYSFPYVSSWTQDNDRLRTNLEQIQYTSNDLIAMVAGGVEPGETLT